MNRIFQMHLEYDLLRLEKHVRDSRIFYELMQRIRYNVNYLLNIQRITDTIAELLKNSQLIHPTANILLPLLKNILGFMIFDRKVYADTNSDKSDNYRSNSY